MSHPPRKSPRGLHLRQVGTESKLNDDKVSVWQLASANDEHNDAIETPNRTGGL